MTAFLRAARSDAVDLLSALVAIPSLSGEETAVATFLAGWLRDRGVAVEVLGDNVVATVAGAAGGPTLLWNSHLDTVPAGADWHRDPWSPAIVDGRLVGLGAGDAKASLAAMASATVTLAAQGLTRGRLVFAATVNEEIGASGLPDVLAAIGAVDAALVGEPTSLQAAIAQSGLLLLEGTCRGRSAHAARAALGRNAVTAAARDLVAIDALVLDRVHPLLGRSGANVTVIRGGDRHNVIPDTCRYTIDVRYTPAYEPEELTALLVATVEADLDVRQDHTLPVETAKDAPIVAALRAAEPGLRLFGSPTMSDWIHLAHVDAVKIGPGDSERSHTPNESVAVAQVRRAAELYAATARRFLGFAQSRSSDDARSEP